MEAIVFEEFGGPEVLRFKGDIEEPHAGPGQVRVKVAAVGVNPIEYKIRNGWMEQAFPTSLPAVPGNEFAGTVDELGEGVTGLSVGDEVLGWSETGAYAAYALAQASAVTPRPTGLEPAAAATLPIAGETAQRVLDLLGVRSGETLLIHGAAGAVGSMGVQLAVALGATVIGTASPPITSICAPSAPSPSHTGTGLWSGCARWPRKAWTRCSTRRARARWRTRSNSAEARRTGSSPSPTPTPPSTT